ncbi:MAG: CRISPR-associated protein Csx16 [Burkholderiaceae bacterium]|nr:CRISPR-associated protein Csx16 [Burkholderiaceae bacterium]
MPKKYFVTRHRGAVTWAAEGGVKARKVLMENFDVAVVQPGDIVMGTLPVHLAARVNARGGHYWHLAMEIPPELRGEELSADDMRACHARLEEFAVKALGVRVSNSPDVPADAATAVAPVHFCIATAQMLANALPMLAMAWSQVVIFSSSAMQAQTDKLVALADLVARQRGLATPACTVVQLPAVMDWGTLHRFAALQAAKWAGQGKLDLNLTGGTKLMAMAFGEAFRSQARQLYCATEDARIEVMDAVQQAALPLAPDLLQVESYLTLQGYRITRQRHAGQTEWLAAVLQRQGLTASLVLGTDALLWENYRGRRIWLKSTQPIKRRAASGDFEKNPAWFEHRDASLLALLHHIGTEAVSEKYRDGTVKTPFCPHVRVCDVPEAPLWRTMLEALQTHGLIADVQTLKADRPGCFDLVFRFTSEAQAVYLGGGYLEEYAFLCLYSLDLPASHYAAGVGIGPLTKTHHKASDETNELDAVAAWNNRLLILECKAGRQLVTGKSQDILNKLDRLKDAAGGSLGMGWLVTSRKLNAKDVDTDADVLQRAELNHITLQAGSQAMRKLGAALAKALGCKVRQPWPSADMVLPALRKPQ